MNNIFSLLQQFQSNPMPLLLKRFNIPQNLHNPNQIIQHLLDTKQITQEQLNQATQMQSFFNPK